MGSGIAQVAALAGHPVMIFDAVRSTAERAVCKIRERVSRNERVSGNSLAGSTSLEADRLDLVAVESLGDLAAADIVVEAVVEDLATKREVFSALEEVVRADCLLASNTSSLRPTALAATLSRPERLVGLHFFNPAPVMALVEVVPGLATAPGIVDTAGALVRSWGKTVVHSRETPGFVVNRVARPFYGEAWRLYEESAATPEIIDAVLTRGALFPMGPFALMDLIGHDVNEAVTAQIWAAFGYEPRFAPSPAQRALVEAGWLGRKARRGVYDYRDGQAPTPAVPAAPCAAPRHVVEHGAAGLAHVIARAGVPTAPGADPHGMAELPEGALLTTSTGVSATALGARWKAPVIVVDRNHERATATAIASSEGCPEPAVEAALGLLQAAGLDVYRVDDTPGLVITRTVAMLVNLAADVVGGRVASSREVDLAMRLGTNYPRGPLAWGDAWGSSAVVEVLDNLREAYGERYRASPLLRRRPLSGTRLVEEDHP